MEQLAGRVDVIYLAIDCPDILKTKPFRRISKRYLTGREEVETVARNAGIVMDTGKVARFSCFVLILTSMTRERTDPMPAALMHFEESLEPVAVLLQ